MIEDKKLCTKCHQLLAFSQFSKGHDKFMLQAVCKACTSAYMKDRHAERREELCLQSRLYQAANKDKINAQRKIFRETNSERLSQEQREKYEKNREFYLHRMREYQKRNRPKILANHAEYYQNHKDEFLKKSKAYRQTTAGKSVLKKAHERERRLHHEKIKARWILANAIRDHRKIRGTHCENCGVTVEIEAHHHNGYAAEFALDVIWLCPPCHKAADREKVLATGYA